MLFLAFVAAAAPKSASDTVTEAALMRHIAVLADDALQGRRPGRAGGRKAVRYIAAQMRAAGLSPGAMDGGWYQPVDLVERRPLGATMQWRAGGAAVPLANDELVLLGRDPGMKLASAPIIFGGYGLKSDLEDADVAGAIVLLLSGNPGHVSNPPPIEARRSALAKAGAAAVVMLMPSDARWENIRGQYRNGRTTLARDDAPTLSGAMAYPAWTRLLAAAGRDPRQLERAAGERGFRAIRLPAEAELRVRTAVRRYRSVNVIGRIDGTGKSGEAVLFTAHWDHLGICRPRGVKDRICNGAVDNASGIAVMLEAARGIAAGPRPVRGILFVATTAEELGLLGARAFVRDPPMPLGAIVANLNLDTMAVAPRGAPVGIVGRGMTPLDPLIEATARALGRKVDTDSEANAYVTRQDGWVLLSAGVPAVMVGGAFSEPGPMGRYFATRYHGPGDDVSSGLELGGAAEDAELHIGLGRALADPTRFPRPAR